MKTTLLSIVLLIVVLPPAVLRAQYSTEAAQIQKLSDQYNQRGYMNGKAVTVDGSLTISNANGVPSYVYPINSYTSNGHNVSVTLNYCGSVAFTSYHRYYNYAYNNTSPSWSKYHQNRPAWLLGVNGFAVQALGFTGTFFNEPAYMKFSNNQNPYIIADGNMYTDKHLVWVMDGYDVCNRMDEMLPDLDEKHDVIRLLRSDGGLLELHNVISYDDLPNDSTGHYTNPALYTGDYYPAEVNPSAYARVQLDSLYIPPSNPPVEQWRLPRILRYYPGDGLEYVFREFCVPYGREPYTTYSTNGPNGQMIYGANMAYPSIFYLEEINDGTRSVVNFKRERHVAEEQMFFNPDTNAHRLTTTRGRAPLTEFTGHTLIYGDNSLSIQAMGRTTNIRFAAVGGGAEFKPGLTDLSKASKSDMFSIAKDGAEAMNNSFEIASNRHKCWLALVTSITDEEGRETRFEYERYTRQYNGVGFPHDLNAAEEKPVKLVNWRINKVIEPTTEYRLGYQGQLDTTLNASANQLLSIDPQAKRAIKYALTPTIRFMDKDDRSGVRQSTQNFDLFYPSTAIPSDLGSTNFSDQWVSSSEMIDRITGQSGYTKYHFTAYEFPGFDIGVHVPFTRIYATESKADSMYTYTENFYRKLDDILVQPSRTVTKVKWGSTGVYILKSATSYTYDTTTVRSYPTVSNPTVKAKIARYFCREIAERRSAVLNPEDTTQVLYRTKTSYIHFPLRDTTMTLQVRQWNKFKAQAEYRRRYEEPLSLGERPSVRWEQVLGCIETYDTIAVSGTRGMPPVYGLERRSVLTDANGTIVQGTANAYAMYYKQTDTSSFYRGALMADSVIGYGGVAKLANTYTYYGGLQGYENELMRTRRSATGGLTEYLYSYGCPEQGNGGRVRYNDNSMKTASLYGRNGLNQYESSLGEKRHVRKYDVSGNLNDHLLTSYMERTYHDLVSATVDPNNWYSRYDYDKNGRLSTAWLPFDFHGDSLYSKHWYGKMTIPMFGYTRYYHYIDTTTQASSPSTRFGSLGLSFEDFRMKAALPVTVIPYSTPLPIYTGTNEPVAGKREQVLIGANTPIPFENRKRYLGYCTATVDPDFQSALSLDSATLRLHVTKVFGSCVNFKVSVVVPKYQFFTTYLHPQFDTLLTKTFVLNCSRTINALEAKLTAVSTGLTTDDQQKQDVPSVLSPPIGTASVSPLPYQLLTLDLNPIRSDLLSRNWYIEVAVTTPGGEVEVVNEGEDWRPQLVLKGTFDRTDPLADYTLHYEYADRYNENRTATTYAKVDDSLHTANTLIGPLPEAMDNSRRLKVETAFGMDYRVVRSTETKTKNGMTWKDEVQTAYTGLGLARKVTDQLHDTVSTVYDTQGRPVQMYNPDGTSRTIQYPLYPESSVSFTDQNFYGLISEKRSVDEKGITSAQYYDVFGRLRREVTDTDFLKLTTKYEYDLLGRLTTVVNPKGDTTRYWYDDFGRIRYKYQPDMGYTSYAYDDVGNVRFVQTAQQAIEGTLTFTEYDDMGRVTLIGEARLDSIPTSGGGGGHALYDGGTSDPNNRASLSPVAMPIGENPTTPAGKREQVLSFPPHPVLMLNRRTDQLNGNVLYDNNVSAIPTANKTIWLTPQIALPQFWTLDNLVETLCRPEQSDPKQPSGSLLRHPAQSYNDPGLPKAQAGAFENIALYPQNARTVIHYDELPQSAGSVWLYFPSRAQWDALAPRGSVRNQKARESAVAYRNHAGEPYHYVVMSYDERGRVEALLRYTENLGFDAVYYTYNSMNLVTSVRVADPKRQHTTWYGYNGNGRVDSVWTKLSNDGYGLGVTNPVFPTPQSRPAQPDMTYNYTGRWQVDSLFYPPINTTVLYRYNARRFLDSMVARQGTTPVFRQVLSYDTDGQIIQQKYEHGTAGEKHQEYVYDGAKRLRYFWNRVNVAGMQYTYDAVGNRLATQKYDNGNALWSDLHEYTDAEGPNRLKRLVRLDAYLNRDTTLYTYNANGALVYQGHNGTSEAFSYDNIQGMATRYRRTENGVAQDWRYRYSASGEREQKRAYTSVAGAPKEWTYYLLGGDLKQMAVYKGLETTASSCGTTAPMVYLWATEYNTFGLGGVHNLVTRPTGATTSEKQYKIQDHLGSTRVVLNQSGTVTSRDDYEPFGSVETQVGVMPRKSYIDKETDAESGLGDYGARKYDSDLGRFTSIDPLWEKYRAWSPYAYSLNNPLMLKDPDGQSAVAIITGNVITIEANLYFYGDAANDRLATWYAAQIQKQWNAGAKRGVVINGKTYEVKFKITGKVIPEKNVGITIAKNTDYRNNYIFLSEKTNWDGFSNMDHFRGDKKGGANTGSWLIDGPKGENPWTTPAHEFGHSLGYSGGDALGHDQLDLTKENPPNIMVPGGGNPANIRVTHLRIVYPRTIAKIFEGKDLSKGTLNLGRLTNEAHHN